MKIFSWNINGIRAVIRKGELQKFITDFEPDILCLQETKAKRDQVEIDLPNYVEVWNSAKRAGYSGTAIFVKNDINIINKKLDFDTDKDLADGFGDIATEGRVIALEFKDFFMVTVYTPNSKAGLERLKMREKLWDPEFLEYLKKLEKTKPVIVCGDFNAAHEAIDLARPKSNEHSAGFTSEERRGITNIISAGFIDTFRFLHPNEQRFSWWSHFGNARANNIGWRIDYFFISKSLQKNLKKADIHESVFGSDHCPISLEMEF